MVATVPTEGSRDLLVEIGMEELPPRSLRSLRDALEVEVVNGLAVLGLRHGAVHSFATPRRLAVRVEALAVQQPMQTIERRGPAMSAAFHHDGTPTRAALGFANSCGVEVSALESVRTDKGDWLFFRGTKPGGNTAELIPDLLENAIKQLPIPKRMRWGAGDYVFVRPVHWVVVLFGDNVIPVQLMGVRSGRNSRGHRFHQDGPVLIAEPREYEHALLASHVIADHDQRLQRIRAAIGKTAADAGGVADIDEDLLEEVTSLVEWPVPILGSFDSRFLAIPSEVLVSSMQEHQRYFPVRNPDDGTLLPLFVTIANIDSEQPEAIVRGNERVIRPRLADAEFFWNQDRKQPLESLVEGLDSVVYQKGLGTLGDKTRRVTALAAVFAPLFNVGVEEAKRVASLAKCDLLTEMVGEFPDLQGTMGKYYAKAQGEPEGIAKAVEEHYWPRHAGDALPTTALGSLVAVCDRCDTLLGAFSIGQVPTGDKDPYALRRAGLGVLRILSEGGWRLSLRSLIQAAASHASNQVAAEAAIEPLLAFLFERMKGYYQEAGHPVERFEAVRNASPTVEQPADFRQRMIAVQLFERESDTSSLIQMNKRIRNILRKAGDEPIPVVPEPGAFEQEEEWALFQACRLLEERLDQAIVDGDYERGLRSVLELEQPLSAFFEQVLVMAEDPAVQRNRLSLLQNLQSGMRRIADLSHLNAS